MDARTFDKAKPPSSRVPERLQRATRRSSDGAMGGTAQQNRQVQVVKAGSESGGSTANVLLLAGAVGEWRIDANLFDVAENFNGMPYIAGLKVGADNVAECVLSEDLSDEELASRSQKWEPRQTGYASDAIWKYAREIDPARDGVVVYSGGKAEKICYADQ